MMTLFSALVSPSTSRHVSGSDSEVQLWGLGVVQEIDAAAMSIWLSYRHLEGEASTSRRQSSSSDLDDFQYVKAGALINF